jgi:hypothetical protein
MIKTGIYGGDGDGGAFKFPTRISYIFMSFGAIVDKIKSPLGDAELVKE